MTTLEHMFCLADHDICNMSVHAWMMVVMALGLARS